MNMDGLINKYKTYPHPKEIDRKQIERALKLNIPIEHLDMSEEKIDMSPHRIDLAERNILPSYVNTMMEDIKLNTISSNYKNYRLASGYNV